MGLDGFGQDLTRLAFDSNAEQNSSTQKYRAGALLLTSSSCSPPLPFFRLLGPQLARAAINLGENTETWVFANARGFFQHIESGRRVCVAWRKLHLEHCAWTIVGRLSCTMCTLRRRHNKDLEQQLHAKGQSVRFLNTALIITNTPMGCGNARQN